MNDCAKRMTSAVGAVDARLGGQCRALIRWGLRREQSLISAVGAVAQSFFLNDQNRPSDCAETMLAQCSADGAARGRGRLWQQVIRCRLNEHGLMSKRDYWASL